MDTIQEEQNRFKKYQQCNCCAQHMKHRPISLYSGWVNTNITSKSNKSNQSNQSNQCQCQCQNIMRELAKNNNSLLEIYCCQTHCDIVVRLPHESPPQRCNINDRECDLRLLTTAIKNIDHYEIDKNFTDEDLYAALYDGFDMNFIHREIIYRVGDAYCGESIAYKLEQKWRKNKTK